MIQEKLGLEAIFREEPWPSLDEHGDGDVLDADEMWSDDEDDEMLGIVLALTQIESLIDEGESLGIVARAGENQCITASLVGLFPDLDRDDLREFNETPSYRDVLTTLPIISSEWCDDLECGHKFLVHTVNHCIGVDVCADHVDCWDTQRQTGQRLRLEKKSQLLDLMREFKPFLRVSPSDNNAAQPHALVGWQYDQRAGSPIYFTKSFMKTLKAEVEEVDLDSCQDENGRWRCSLCTDRHFGRYPQLSTHHKYHLKKTLSEGTSCRQAMVIENLIQIDKVRASSYPCVLNVLSNVVCEILVPRSMGVTGYY